MCKNSMSREEIMKIIPHRDPMLLIDEIIEMNQGEWIKSKFYVSPDRSIFQGHFPEAPVLPGVYTVEIMAQTSDVLILSMDRYKNTIPYFIGIDQVKFKAKIEPGDTVEVISKILRENKEKGIVTCSAEVFKNEEVVCTGDVTLAMR
jgi:3-hydroxyacyl-[acyl-carrier-protein] dehydratase